MDRNWPKFLRRKLAEIFPLLSFAEYILLRVGMAVINFFPLALSTWIARRIGDILFLAMPGRRKVALENLDIAFGDSKTYAEKRRIARESFCNLIICFTEFSRLPRFAKIWRQHITFYGAENIINARAEGRGIIFAMSHLGPWEYVAFLAKYTDSPTTIIGRAIRNPYVYRWIVQLRQSAGLEYHDKDKGIKPLFSEVKKGNAVAIVIDQWAGNQGVWVDFFSKSTSTTYFPARLSKKTNSALVSGCCVRKANGSYEIHVDPEIIFDKKDNDYVENATRELNRRLEEKIRIFPEQWTWTHRRWKNRRHAKEE